MLRGAEKSVAFLLRNSFSGAACRRRRTWPPSSPILPNKKPPPREFVTRRTAKFPARRIPNFSLYLCALASRVCRMVGKEWRYTVTDSGGARGPELWGRLALFEIAHARSEIGAKQSLRAGVRRPRAALRARLPCRVEELLERDAELASNTEAVSSSWSIPNGRRVRNWASAPTRARCTSVSSELADRLRRLEVHDGRLRQQEHAPSRPSPDYHGWRATPQRPCTSTPDLHYEVL